MKTIAITGASGFVGTNFKNFFSKKNFKVLSISRTDLKNNNKLLPIIEEAHIIINLAGANIIGRWTESYKKELYNSRLNTTKALIKAFEVVQNKPELLISTSAVGIYKNSACYDEFDYEYSNDFLGKLCKDWENEASKANNFGLRTVIFRFGIILGEGGALEKMLPPFKMGLGGTIGDGKQSFSYIHIEDLLNAYNFVIENNNFSGIFNLTAPTPTTNKGLTKALGKTLRRPTLLPVPEFMLNLIFSEGAKVLTDGQCVYPKRLQESGFEFKYKTIEETIENLLDKDE